MPPIAPPLRPPPPLWLAAAVEFEFDVDDDVGLLVVEPLVVEDKRFEIVEKTGRVTSWQRPVEFEVRQQESVPL